MSGNKQFHVVSTPAGDKPLVAAAFDTIAHVCDQMFVALGHRADEVATVLAPRRFMMVLSDPDAPMVDSIKTGLHEILSRTATRSGFQNPAPRPAVFLGLGRPTLPEGGCSLPSLREGRSLRAGEGPREGLFLLQLGDHPSLQRTTLDQLLYVAADNPNKAIMPTYKGNGGHPVVIPLSVAEQILASPCPDGLRQFWNDHPELCGRLEVNDPGVLENVNAV
jgi:CTP:molybdopterin cytidylyltransferase MocA